MASTTSKSFVDNLGKIYGGNFLRVMAATSGR